MIAKCECQNCRQAVEFEAADFEFNSETSHRKLGQTINCPHCQQPTQIYMNKAEFIAPKKPGLVADLKEIWTDPKWLERQEAKRQELRQSMLIPCADCGKEISKRAFFCPSCGSMGKSLFFKICDIVLAFYFVTLFFGLMGWLILKLIALVFGS